EMVRVLYKAEEDLRRYFYNKPLLIVHSNGGVARVAKTKAMDTHNSGPVAGLMGSIYMSNLYKLNNVITLDIGGTSTDVGLIKGGKVELSYQSEIAGIPINLPIFEVQSVGAGGGSIAAADGGAQAIKVGPQSAGALPGPACYDLGGYNPTATDADVVLGYIDPEYFLGGQRILDKSKAVEAIQSDVSDALDLEVEEAALKIHAQLALNAANEIKRVLSAKGTKNTDFVLYAFGGAGGNYACDIAKILDIKKVLTFQQNSVFSAFGSSITDVLHIYEEKKAVKLAPAAKAEETGQIDFNGCVEALRKRAETDIRGEGFDLSEMKLSLELDMTSPKLKFSTTIESPRLALNEEPDVLAIMKAFQKKAQKAGFHDPHQSAIKIVNFRLKATAPIPHFRPLPVKAKGVSPKKALKGKRPVYWQDGFAGTNIYERGLLKCGNVVEGPAIIEAEDTTYAIPAGWKFTVDEYMNGIMEEVI
ncbi:hydantoinase/oxoprolinase family protein, partial [Thermodesulfobacteriota bacterium]